MFSFLWKPSTRCPIMFTYSQASLALIDPHCQSLWLLDGERRYMLHTCSNETQRLKSEEGQAGAAFAPCRKL